MADKSKTMISLQRLEQYDKLNKEYNKVRVITENPKSSDSDYATIAKRFYFYQGTSALKVDENGKNPTDDGYIETWDTSKAVGSFNLDKELVATGGSVIKVEKELVADSAGKNPGDDGYVRTESGKIMVDGNSSNLYEVADVTKVDSDGNPDSAFYGYPTEEGTYIKIDIANQVYPIFINVLDLVNDFTVKADAKEIQLTVSDTREISAEVVVGSIKFNKLHPDVQKMLTATSGAVTVGDSVSKVADLPLTTCMLGESHEVDEDGQVYVCTKAAIVANTLYTDGSETVSKEVYDAMESSVKATYSAVPAANGEFQKFAITETAIGDVRKTIYVKTSDSSEISAEAYQVLVDAYVADGGATLTDPSTEYTARQVFRSVKDYVDDSIANNIIVATENDIKGMFA